jgi:hypothetical protein
MRMDSLLCVLPRRASWSFPEPRVNDGSSRPRYSHSTLETVGPDSADSAVMAEPPRRFPTPWHAKKIPGGYVVRYANGRERIPAKLRAYAIAGGTEAGLS